MYTESAGANYVNYLKLCHKIPCPPAKEFGPMQSLKTVQTL